MEAQGLLVVADMVEVTAITASILAVSGPQYVEIQCTYSIVVGPAGVMYR